MSTQDAIDAFVQKFNGGLRSEEKHVLRRLGNSEGNGDKSANSSRFTEGIAAAAARDHEGQHSTEKSAYMFRHTQRLFIGTHQLNMITVKYQLFEAQHEMQQLPERR